MAMTTTKPIMSERFDLDDIRSLRNYNASRYEKMTKEEIIAETRAGAAKFFESMKKGS